MAYRQMRRLIERHGYYFDRPNGNAIDIVRYENQSSWLGRTKQKRIHCGTIGYPSENREMTIGDIKKVRQICRLREEDGVDSDAFYTETAVIDAFVNRYRSVLRRLAKV